ncbi:hypothetical protein [Romboutsia sp.]|uniref:hypothetical protein n=1 Tax=Romboutsia sp. TaxID=1965302 RepID=UPI002B9A9F6F|nr:hypothetical protein [Romboutsia sp.]HSQ87769.1 hypothetical protein [Romboutsia sp.]
MYIETIEKMVKNNKKIAEIGAFLGLKIAKMRKIILENNIAPDKNDKEYDYFLDAKTIKSCINDAYFMTDLAELANLTHARVKVVCDMYGLKPCKKAYCTHCGKEIDLSKSKVVSKYCSRSCYDKKRRPAGQKPIIKTCKVCGSAFEGKSNSKYCNENCKEFASAVRSGMSCLKNL